MDGLEVAERLEELADNPYVVLDTAYSEFAVRAFEVSAFDYLIEPVAENRMEQTVNRLLSTLDASASQSSEHPKRLDRLAVNRGDKMVLQDLEHIHYFQADGDYSRVFAESGSYLANYSLKALQDRLDHKHFFRCHRGYKANR